MVRDALAEVLQEQQNRTGVVGGSQGAQAAADLLPPLELIVAVLVISMACAAVISTCWVFCDLPYPGRLAAERRAIEQKRAAAAVEAWIVAEDRRRESDEKCAALRQHLSSKVGPNISWGGRRHVY